MKNNKITDYALINGMGNGSINETNDSLGPIFYAGERKINNDNKLYRINVELSLLKGIRSSIAPSEKESKAYYADFNNWPFMVPDTETCKVLDRLSQEDKLSKREVKYYMTLDNYFSIMTDVYDEYRIEDKRFIKMKVDKSKEGLTLSNGEPIVANKEYWIEVGPQSLLFEMTDDKEMKR